MYAVCRFHTRKEFFFSFTTKCFFLRGSDDIKKCSDSEIIRRYIETDNNELVGELFQRYTHLVFGVCMKYLKDADDAQDAVMQIFEKLLTDLKKHEVQYFKGWLYMVAKNHCLMYLRSKKIHVELPRNLSVDEDGNEESTVVEFAYEAHLNGEQDKEIQLTHLEEAIKELKESQKICVELFYSQEKSYEEVAKMTGYTMKEVKSYIQNGKRNLKIIMTTQREKSK